MALIAHNLPVQTRGPFRIVRTPLPMGRPDAARHRARIAIALFVVAVALLVMVAPAALRYLYPVAAFGLAALLFARSRATYVSFVFWLYFLSPLLRRIDDYRAGSVAVSPLLLAPVFATAVAGYVLSRNFRTLSRSGALTFTCALAGIFFGTVVGLVHYSPVDVGRAFLNWVPPVLFGFFLYMEREHRPAIRRAIGQALLYGTLVMGAYAIFQFLVLPAWDQRWMIDTGFEVFGVPEPLRIRAFSTMNAPATLATYMMSGLLMLFGLKGRLRWAVAPLGFAGLLLTASRASWLGFIPGMIFLALQLPAKARVRIVAALLGCVVLAGLATLIPAIDEVVGPRLQSVSNPSQDVSYNARLIGHEEAFNSLASEPLGEGLGSTDVDHATTGRDDRLGPHDSTVLELLYSLGGPGSLLYLLGLAFGVFQLWRAGIRDTFSLTMAAILVAFASEFLLNSIFVGVLGFMVWTAIGMSLGQAEEQGSGYRV